MTQKSSFNGSDCPVARGVGILGDKWVLMIIRDMFDQPQRFSVLQKNLGVAKNILSTRLSFLEGEGIVATSPATQSGTWRQYQLTEKGLALFPLLISLRQWGERYLFTPGEQRSLLVDGDGVPLAKMAVRDALGNTVAPQECRRTITSG